MVFRSLSVSASLAAAVAGQEACSFGPDGTVWTTELRVEVKAALGACAGCWCEFDKLPYDTAICENDLHGGVKLPPGVDACVGTVGDCIGQGTYSSDCNTLTLKQGPQVENITSPLEKLGKKWHRKTIPTKCSFGPDGTVWTTELGIELKAVLGPFLGCWGELDNVPYVTAVCEADMRGPTWFPPEGVDACIGPVVPTSCVGQGTYSSDCNTLTLKQGPQVENVTSPLEKLGRKWQRKTRSNTLQVLV